MSEQINKLYIAALVAPDGSENICGPNPNECDPMICTRSEDLEATRPAWQAIADGWGKVFRVLEFTGRSVYAEVAPNGQAAPNGSMTPEQAQALDEVGALALDALDRAEDESGDDDVEDMEDQVDEEAAEEAEAEIANDVPGSHHARPEEEP